MAGEGGRSRNRRMDAAEAEKDAFEHGGSERVDKGLGGEFQGGG